MSSILKDEKIDVFISSPYERAIQTIHEAAGGKEILLFEDLRERAIGQIGEVSFKKAKLKVYEDFHYSFSEGESSSVAQSRAVKVIDQILTEHQGKKIVIGTHGDIMTLIFNHYDSQYNFGFWESTSMPDIYRLVFDEQQSLLTVKRLW